MDKASVTKFISEYNEAGGKNPNELYENAVCFALNEIFNLPNVTNEKIKNIYPFLVKRTARLAVYQNVVRINGKDFFSITRKFQFYEYLS